MAKRRKKRKISTALSEYRADDLIGGMAGLLSGLPTREELYDSELQRRAVYFANKQKLIDQAVEQGPGQRPAAFWEYEVEGIDEQRPGLDPVCLKYLIENNLLMEGEFEAIQALFLSRFDIYNNLVTSVMRDGRHDSLVVELEAAAKVLGGAALEAWDKLSQEVKNEQP